MFFVEFNSSCCIIHGHFLEKIVFKLVFCSCFNEHVFSDWRVCVSVCARTCSRPFLFHFARVRGHLRARACVCAGVCNSDIKYIQFWLRTSALRVFPVETRLAVHRRVRSAVRHIGIWAVVGEIYSIWALN
jgi:hypothetical protein